MSPVKGELFLTRRYRAIRESRIDYRLQDQQRNIRETRWWHTAQSWATIPRRLTERYTRSWFAKHAVAICSFLLPGSLTYQSPYLWRVRAEGCSECDGCSHFGRAKCGQTGCLFMGCLITVPYFTITREVNLFLINYYNKHLCNCWLTSWMSPAASFGCAGKGKPVTAASLKIQTGFPAKYSRILLRRNIFFSCFHFLFSKYVFKISAKSLWCFN